jgi:hypothetical protein
MIELRKAGYSYGAIAERLNAKGYCRQNGACWDRPKVHQSFKCWGQAGPVPLRRTLPAERAANIGLPDDD